MKLYVMRSLRWLLRMAIILAAALGLLALAGTLDMGDGNLIQALFFSRKGLLLTGILIIFAGFYPWMAFGAIEIRADIDTDRQEIINAFASYGYDLVRDEPGQMIFRAKSAWKRVSLQYDDTITVVGEGGKILVEGMKKEITRVETRLGAFIFNK